MKINIVVGGTFHAPILASNLIRLGYDVKIYTSTPKFKFKDKALLDKVVFVPMIFQIFRKLINRPIWSGFKYFDSVVFDWVVSKIMRDCDVVYGFAGNSCFSGASVKQRGGKFILDRACPHIEYQNDLLLSESKELQVKFYKLGRRTLTRSKLEYQVADRIVVPSKYTYNTFLGRDVDFNKIDIIPLDANASAPQKNPKKTNTGFTIGVVGGGLLRKGYIYLFRAWDELCIDGGRLLIKGNKSELIQSKEIQNIIKRNKNIEFVDYVEDINDFYKECDIFCLPSIDDGFGMVVFEAMANALPVIVTKNVGASTFVSHGENGYIVNIKKSDELREKFLLLYKNKSKLLRFSKRSLKIYKNYVNSNASYLNGIRNLFLSL
ncbi:glycosyltransferase family 4 protein [Candidatus Thioglobus sp.]|nr:glycosyltransferase family 4 protein [Candidatus Thioglobus sp.]